MNISALSKKALRRGLPGCDEKGYARRPEENLLPGIELATVEDDLRGGDGDELRAKFCAVHSSCALAVNSFGRFKAEPDKLVLLGKRGASSVKFEYKLPIFSGCRAPNLDVWIERGNEVIAIESKLTEYLTPKKPEFSERYQGLAYPKSELRWWRLYEEIKNGGEQYLDRAQLLKHYFGLSKFRGDHPAVLRTTLLYIFWEPLDWKSFEEFGRHRSEVERFAESVSGSEVNFVWTTYNDLWKEWEAIPDLAGYAADLEAKYQVHLQQS
jgi:hypothetical protein